MRLNDGVRTRALPTPAALHDSRFEKLSLRDRRPLDGRLPVGLRESRLFSKDTSDEKPACFGVPGRDMRGWPKEVNLVAAGERRRKVRSAALSTLLTLASACARG